MYQYRLCVLQVSVLLFLIASPRPALALTVEPAPDSLTPGRRQQIPGKRREILEPAAFLAGALALDFTATAVP